MSKKYNLLIALFLICWQANAQVCFLPVDSFTNGKLTGGLVSADFNRDGKMDLAISQDSLSIFIGDGTGSFNAPLSFESHDGGVIISADFNNDSILDIALLHYSPRTATILLGVGNGAFGAPMDFNTAHYGLAMCSADFDGDGNLDIALTLDNPANVVSIHFGNGSGGFSTNSNYYSASYIPQSIIAEDLNNDGFVDIVTSNLHNDNISILLGLGNGTFAATTNTSVGTSSPGVVISNDFNKDGFVDLAISKYSDKTLVILLGNGTGNFSSNNFITSLGFRPEGEIITNDFNSDSIPDIAITHNNKDSISIFLGTGTGNFTLGGHFLTVGIATTLSSADYNNDGKIDVTATGYYTRKNVSILLNCTVPLGLNTQIQNNNTLPVAPNPASNTLTISNIKEKTQLHLFDMFGKTILIKETEGNIVLDVSNMPQGIYTLFSSSKNYNSYNKIVVVRE